MPQSRLFIRGIDKTEPIIVAHTTATPIHYNFLITIQMERRCQPADRLSVNGHFNYYNIQNSN